MDILKRWDSERGEWVREPWRPERGDGMARALERLREGRGEDIGETAARLGCNANWLRGYMERRSITRIRRGQ